MADTTAEWSLSLDTQCPQCKHVFDLRPELSEGCSSIQICETDTGATGQPVTEPVPTVTAGTSKRPGGNGHALGIVEAALTPLLAGNGGSEYQAKPRPLDRPAHTILKQSRACLVAPVIARQFGASVGHRADEPSATITAGGGGKSQLVTPTLFLRRLLKHWCVLICRSFVSRNK